jgi:hypothetical protein
MIEKHLKPIAHAMLQARVDGKLSTPGQGIAMIGKFQPAKGWSTADIKAISDFGMEIKQADTIPGAKVIAEKYKLDIVY